MRKKYGLMGLAITVAGASACVTSAAPAEDVPAEIALHRVGRIEVRRDANICVELSVNGVGGRGLADYELGRAKGASVHGVFQVMTEAGADTSNGRGQSRILAMGGPFAVDEECPDADRDLRIMLHLSQDRPETPYLLIVEFRQGAALYRKGVDRRDQRWPQIPPVSNVPGPGGYIVDPFDTRPWTLEIDARQLTAELAALVNWNSDSPQATASSRSVVQVDRRDPFRLSTFAASQGRQRYSSVIERARILMIPQATRHMIPRDGDTLPRTNTAFWDVTRDSHRLATRLIEHIFAGTMADGQSSPASLTSQPRCFNRSTLGTVVQFFVPEGERHA